jgi:hypothetical protein
VVRETGSVHVLANSDDAVPPGFPVDHLYGITWNPEKLIAALAAIPGLAPANRIAVDGMTPGVGALLERVSAGAQLVDAAPILAALWRLPDPERSAGVAASADIARAAISEMAHALHPGVRARTLRGIAARRIASSGVTTPAFEAVAAPLTRTGSTWLSPERTLADGERVVLRAGVLASGWEASLARTYQVGTPAVEEPAPVVLDPIVAACVPGTTAGALRDMDAVVYGAGLGVEPWNDDFVLAPGVICAIEVGSDTSVRQDLVRVTATTPEILT